MVVDDGTGFWHACSAAELLGERGLAVVLATPANAVGLRIPPESMGPLYQRLASLGVRFAPFLDLADVDATGALLRHTLTGRETKTLMKLLVDRASQRVVGAHMLGAHAGEIVQGIAVALKCGATKAQVDATVGIHPTVAEEFVTMREPVGS